MPTRLLGRTALPGRPVVMGHRGSGKGHGENTIDSFAAAAAAGAQWVEADVRTCADGSLVIAHNPTSHDGRFFSELSVAEVQAQGVITLIDLLEFLPAGLGLNLEIKSSLEDAGRDRASTTAALVAARVATLPADRPLMITSFDPSTLVIVREVAPAMPVGLLGWTGFPLRKLIPAGVHLGCAAVVANIHSFGDNRLDGAPARHDPVHAVQVAHDAGIDVVVWCPRVPQMNEMVRLRVDGVVVDDVAGTLAALDACVAGAELPFPGETQPSTT